MQQTNFTSPKVFFLASWRSKTKFYLQRLTTVAVLLAGVGISQQALAQSFTSASLSIAASTTGANTTSTTYYGARPTNSTPKFNGTQLSTATDPIDPFNASGTLNITTIADAVNPRGAEIVSSNFYYRVYAQGITATATNPAYTQVNLTLTSNTNQDNPTTYGSNAIIDLLTVPRINGGGTYVVDIYYDETDQDIGDPNSASTRNDPSNGPSAPYRATFVVAAPATTPIGATTTWLSTSSTAWFSASNWSNGVPTGSSDAIIPENKQGTNIIFPVLNNIARNYQVRNLTLNGTTNSGRAQLTIQQAVLHVYGNIQQLSGGLVGTIIGNAGVLDSTRNSTLMLRGGNQFITGSLSVPDVIVSGTDIKSVANALLPTNIISFLPTTSSGVIVQSASAQQNQDGTVTYVFDTTGNSQVNLGSTGTISTAAIGQETNVSYIKGIVTAARALVATDPVQTFGNIGIDFTPNHNAALVTVQRIIGDPLLGPTTPSPGVTPVPIRRQFNITGDDNSATAATANSSNDVVFHYLDSTYELNTIMESNLALFRTTTGSAPYTALGGILNTNTNTVTRATLPSLPSYYLTLGDRTNPLPVSIVAFNAVRNANNALLSWTTATEENNKGFNVQVSKDGANFRTIGYVASKLVNSVQALNYIYTDVEGDKTGTRYYRLEQVDIDGKTSYSPVRAVSFDGSAATSVALVAYPNPFTDTVGLTLEGLTVTDGAVAYAKIVDMTGHTVRDQKLSLAGASLSLGDLSDLRSGLYLAKVTLPDGTTKTVRIQRR